MLRQRAVLEEEDLHYYKDRIQRLIKEIVYLARNLERDLFIKALKMNNFEVITQNQGILNLNPIKIIVSPSNIIIRKITDNDIGEITKYEYVNLNLFNLEELVSIYNTLLQLKKKLKRLKQSQYYGYY